MTPAKLILPTAASIILASSAQAATVVYDFTGNPTQASSTSVKTSAATSNGFGLGVSVSALTLTPGGGGTSSITSDHGMTGNMHGFVSYREPNPTVSFTITIPINVEVDLTSLAFTYGVTQDNTAVSAGIYTLVSSLGGITSGADNAAAPLNRSSAGTTLGSFTAGFGGSLQNLTNTTVTFTWSLDSNALSGANALRGHIIDDVVLTGTATAIPEPTAALLGGLGLLALLRRRRA